MIYLEHILEAIELLEDYTRNIKKVDFKKSREKQDAINIEL